MDVPLRSDPTGRTRQSPAVRFGELALAGTVWALSAIVAAPILLVDRFVSRDGPFTDLDVTVARSLHTPSSPWRGFYASRLGGSFSGTLVERLLLHAGQHLGPYAAEKLLVFSFVILLGPAALYFLRRTNPRASRWALAVPGLALSWPLSMGFYGFAAALPLLLVTLGHALPDIAVARARSLVAAAVLLILLDLADPGVALLAATALLIHAPLGAARGRRLAVFTRVGLAALPAILPAAMTLAGSLRAGGAFAAPAAESIAFLPSHLSYTHAPIAWALVAIPAAWLSGRIVHRFLQEALIRRAGERLLIVLRRSHAYPALYGAVLLVILVAPDEGTAFTGATARLPLLLFLLGLAWVPPFRAAWSRTVAGATLCALSLAVVPLHVREIRRRAAAVHEYLAVGDGVPRGATLLPVTFVASGARFADTSPDLVHAWAYLAIDRRVRVPLSTGADAAAFSRYLKAPSRAGWRAPDQRFGVLAGRKAQRCASSGMQVACAESRSMFEDLLRYGLPFDRMLLWEPPGPLLDLAASRGYRIRRRTLHAVLLEPPGRP